MRKSKGHDGVVIHGSGVFAEARKHTGGTNNEMIFFSVVNGWRFCNMSSFLQTLTSKTITIAYRGFEVAGEVKKARLEYQQRG